MTLLIGLLLFGLIQASSADSAATAAWFQRTEQALMDACGQERSVN
jgi:hypothetical protein